MVLTLIPSAADERLDRKFAEERAALARRRVDIMVDVLTMREVQARARAARDRAAYKMGVADVMLTKAGRPPGCR
jgi:hypothetical protein